MLHGVGCGVGHTGGVWGQEASWGGVGQEEPKLP